MNLAAIDIGTNSIHMIIVKVIAKEQYEVLVQEKEMVKLGVGVFANKMLSQRAFDAGIETISRYVQLADEYGVEHIITAATSATREAKNGREFLDRLIHDVGLSPQMISGKEEARLIFLAVRKSIDLHHQNAMVIDIGGGSTEVVIGNRDNVFFKNSLKLGVLRLLDRIGDQGPLTKSKQNALKRYVREIAKKTMEEAVSIGFSKVIGTSGTIRALGEAALELNQVSIVNSVNAEVVNVKDLSKVVSKLLDLPADKRTEVKGINENRVDAIHLGGLLILELLKMSKVNEITLSDASLRDGLIIDYIEKNSLKLGGLVLGKNIKERSCFLLALKCETDLEEKKHIASLALSIYDQLAPFHQLESESRDLLYHACLVYDVGLFVNFQNYHKHAAYLILNGRLRGFNSEELLMLSLLARYHRKKGPKKRQKQIVKFGQEEQNKAKILIGILRIAVGLDKTKNQWVEKVECEVVQENIKIKIFGDAAMDLEIWEAQRFSDVLAKCMKRKVTVVKG